MLHCLSAMDGPSTTSYCSRLVKHNRIGAMSLGDATGSERFEVVYLVLSGTTTAARGPELLRGLIGLGCSTVIAIPTPNASRVIAPRDLADVAGVQVVEFLFRSGDPATTSAGRGTVRALQLQFAQQTRTWHCRQPGAVRGRRGNRATYAGDCGSVAQSTAAGSPRGAGIAKHSAQLACGCRAAG